jgi:competence protein ComEC
MRERRGMGGVGLAFLCGHCVIHGLPQLPTVHLLPALAALIVIALLARVWLLLALLAGIAWAWAHADGRLEHDLPTCLEGRDLTLRGYVSSLADTGAAPSAEAGRPFDLDVIDRFPGLPARVRLSWYDSVQRPGPGELWQLTVRLKRRNGFANPGGFDYEAHLFRQGIGATGYVREDARNRRLDGPSYRYSIVRLRAWASARIAEAAPGEPMLGILQGLAVGDTQAMSADQWRIFAATGTTHLMAISGLHISMIAALAAWLGSGIVRWRRAQAAGWTAMHGQVIAGMLAALAYSTLAGLSVPTQRTLIMLCIYFAARWGRRELTVGHALGLALFGVLLADPFAPLAAGAWLSFGAVAVILLAVSGRVAREGLIASFTRVQLAVTLGLIPLLLAVFGGLSLVSPLANALAVPLFTLVIVPTVLVGMLVAMVSSPVAHAILALPSQLLDWLWPLLQWLAAQPLAIWHFAAPATGDFVALLIGTGLLLLPGVWPTRVAGALLCVPLLVNRPATPAVGDFELTVLDVGQGLAVAVQTSTHTLVYDAGPAFQTGRDAGELAVLPWLRQRGIRALDMLVISHGHLDHQGGMRSILSALPVRQVLIGSTVKNAPAARALCERGQHWSWDGVRFTVLYPGTSGHRSENSSSCVLRIEGRAGSALLTGDIEADAEGELVRTGLGEVDVLIAPHHGSASSSTHELVAAARPRLVLFAAGYRNRWGFPRAEIQQRWRAAGAQTYTTAEGGALTVVLADAQPLEVREHRRARRRYWQR